MTNELDQLLALLREKWLPEWTSTPELCQALECLAGDARMGLPTALPVVQASAQRIGWLTLARSRRALVDYLDDARIWLEAVDADAIGHEVTLPNNLSGPLAPILKVLAPEGYVRWDTPVARGQKTLLRLAKMHRFLATRPDLVRERAPSTAALRFEFISALGVGDWSHAESCIDEIDHWNLAHAHTTLQMRIRLLEARGATEELFDFARQAQVWKLANPQRIAVAILAAVDVSAIQPVESSAGFEAAFTLYRKTWHSQLINCIGDARGAHGATRLLAYAAASDNDRRTLISLLPCLPADLAEFLQTKLQSSWDGAVSLGAQVQTLIDPVPVPDAVGSANLETAFRHGSERPLANAQSGYSFDALTYWEELCVAVKAGDAIRVRTLITSLGSGLLDDPNILGAAPDAILELLSDPAIDSHPSSRVLLYEVLAELIDAFVVAPGFPRFAHQDVYLSLLEGMVTLRGQTANEADSQLVLGLIGALINLSADNVGQCEQIIRSWWNRRPIVQRLNWLAAALDTLAPLHADSQRLIDLYTDGLLLAARKAVNFPLTEGRRWRAIGHALEMPVQDIDELLAPLTRQGAADHSDPLAGAGLAHIAIVSLREPSAQEAALQLQSRTGAKISIVTSLVAGQETRHALSADLILYVWASTSHATYRAFDGCRDKLEYVQGTGATSIVLAAERWAARFA